MTTTRHITAKESAQIIRAELKEAFPGVKFSVRMDRGYSIRVTWTDGPTKASVAEIATKFDGKGFDGMIDLQYYIDGWMLNGKIIGTRCTGTLGSRGTVSPWGMIPPHDDAELVGLSAGYIACERTISADLARKCAAMVANFWGGVDYIPEIIDGGWDGGYKFAKNEDYNRDIRPDLRDDWSMSIRAAAEDASKFAREARV